MEKNRRFLSLFSNWVSALGVVTAICGFILALTMMLIDILWVHSSAYMGVVIYLLFPGIMGGGILLALLGAFVEMRRRKRGGDGKAFPVMDMNDPRLRRRFFAWLLGLLIFLAISSAGVYRVYHFTESVEFCGKLCHQVMKPEYVAYGQSPHARVKCAECHIGPGAGWFVKAKLSGMYQVYSTAFNKYHRPIEVPVENLRPPRETCSECHWPKKFFGAVLRTWTYYLPDEANSPWTIKMLLKVGGGDGAHGPVEGIHWHMNEENAIDYVSKDDKRLVIPWVRVMGKDGTVTVYRTEEEEDAVSDEAVGKMAMRRMDCIDCHNRPTHHYRSPNKALDLAMRLGKISSDVPEIKLTAAELLAEEYETETGAHEAIAKALQEKYSERTDVAEIIEGVQEVFSNNIFPEMKVTWREYPDHVGHKITPGCFRCHDGKHVSDDGKKISRNCDVCHTILSQGPGLGDDELLSKGQEFRHPEDIDGDWKTEYCHTCHEGIPM